MSDELDKANQIKEAVRSYEQLQAAINAIPLEELKKDVEIHGRFYLRDSEEEEVAVVYSDSIEISEFAGIEVIDKRAEESRHKSVKDRAQHSRQELVEKVGELMRHGGIVDTEAIETLVELGNTIAETLKSWSTPLRFNDLFIEGEIPMFTGKTSHKSYEIATTWRSEFNCAVLVLTNTEEDLLHQLLGDLTQRFEDHLYYFSPNLVPYPKIESDTSSQSHDLVCSLIDNLLLLRIEEERALRVRDIAKQLSYWPTSVSAVADNREAELSNYLDSIQLGQSLGVHLSPKHKKGKPRDLSPDSSYSLTLACFRALDRERKIQHTKETLRKYREDEDNGIGMIPQPGGRRPKFRETDEHTNRHTNSVLELLSSSWTINNIWKRKAALLPELTEETAGNWADAALACLASCGSQDNKDFPWPQQIQEHAKRKKENLETVARQYLINNFSHFSKK